MQQHFFRQIFIILLGIALVLPVMSQDTNTVLEPTQTPSLTPSLETISTIAELTPELTLEISASPSPTGTDSPVVTAEITPEMTMPVEETEIPELTESVILLPELTASAEAVESTPETTELVMATSTPIPAISSVTPTATVGGYALEMLRGEVKYQNRPDHSGITISVLTVDGILLSVASSNSQGIFSLPVPAETVYILRFEAPLHRSLTVEIQPNTIMQNFLLAGGDLNHDSCINDTDMQQLLTNYQLTDTPLSDINSDGLTDLSDLAILTGNFDASCGILAESTESAQ